MTCSRPRTAFVLSGGASLGAIQVGMLRALYERGIRPDLVVGTSVGAVNGAFIASHPPTVAAAAAAADELAASWRRTRRTQVFPLHPCWDCSASSGRATTWSPPPACATWSPSTSAPRASSSSRSRCTWSPSTS